MKKIIKVLLSALILVAGCSNTSVSSINNTEEKIENNNENESLENEDKEWNLEDVPQFENANDKELTSYLEDSVYHKLVNDLNNDGYFIENVEAVYVSKEYIEELSYNSQSNIYFGYTLNELKNQFEGKKYVFDIGENGTTVVHEIEDVDKTYETIMKNVLIGGGVILFCVTVSVVSAPAAPAISVIFATSAKTASAYALSSATISGATKTIIEGYQTGDWNEAIKEGALKASDSFKWGAISGALVGGAKEAIALKGATLSGLSMNDAARIQRESGYPLDVIKTFKNMDQYNICKKAGLKPTMVNGKTALIRDIDLTIKDEFGRTNLERMKEGLAALDSLGNALEIHHIGQKADSTLAILTKAEHMQGGNNKIWHDAAEGLGKVAREEWNNHGRKEFWKAVAVILGG